MNLKSVTPDLVLINGDIYTQDALNSRATAIAIGQGRILAVGDRKAVQSMQQKQTEVIDLGGRLVLPGMTDVHFHGFEWAMNQQHLALADAVSLDRLLEKVESWIEELAPGKWVIGQGWNEADWADPRMPLRKDLDAISPRNPVILWRCDLHLATVNSLALQAGGILDDTPDPEDGRIERDEKGQPTGILKELAINLIRDAIPPPTDQEAADAIKNAVSELHSLGLTGIHDIRLMNDQDGTLALRTWRRLEASGELYLRLWVTVAGEQLDDAIALGLRTGIGNDRLRIGHVKFFADGGMGARTAWLYQPYIDADCGMPLTSIADLNAAISRAESAGLAVMIHAVGDRANGELIRMFEARKNEKNNAGSDPESAMIKHRIEHVQMIRPEDIPRLARTRVAVTIQPHNMILDMNMIDTSVGSRGRWTYPFRDLIDAGIPVMFSSDTPVCDPNPLIGIHAAVTRQRTDSTPPGGWYPESRIRIDEAIRGYTLTPALVHGLSDQLGTITAGKYADLIVLDRDLYTIDPMEIASAAVEMTIFDGQIVFTR